MPNDNSGPQAPTDAGTVSREEAGTRLETLKNDSEWTAKLARGDNAAAAEWNRLFDAANGTTTPKPPAPAPEPRVFQAVPTPYGPSPLPPDERLPISPGAYDFGMPVLQDEGSKAAASEYRQLAFDAGLPAGQFTLISQQAEIDAKRGLDDETHADITDRALRKMFGDDYDRAAAGARLVVADLERQHPGIREKLTASHLNRNVVLLAWLLRKGLER